MAHRSEMQTVDLVDGTSDAETTPGRLSARPPVRRRRLVAGVVALVVLAAVAQGVVAIRERAAFARLAAVPGVLAPVDDTLEVVRRVTPGESVLSETTGGTFELGPDGSQTVRWFSDSSGEPAWTTRLAGPNAALTSTDHLVADTRCQPDVLPSADPAGARRYVCLVSDGAHVYDGNGGMTAVPSTALAVVVLSTTDGSELAQWPLTTGEVLVVLPGDMVVVAAGVGDTAVATGYDLLTGAVRWTSQQHRIPAPDGPLWVDVHRAGDLVAFAPTIGTLVLLDPASGKVVRSDLTSGQTSASYAFDGAHGTFALSVRSADGKSGTLLVAPDGNPADDRHFDGDWVTPAVDDESLPGMLLTIDRGTVRAWDEATGAARWSATVGSAVTLLLVRGRVYVGIQQGAVALDGRTGREQWHVQDMAGMQPGNIFTDGRHLLVPREGRAGGRALSAYDLTDGHEAFRAPYPAGVSGITALGRDLIGYDDEDHIVVLG